MNTKNMGVRPRIFRALQRSPRSSAWVALYSLFHKSYLQEEGWYRSFREQRAVDAAGRPLPWLTYSCIAFLIPRIQPEFQIFEYGSGNSTLWWSRRVRRVVSCEHDRDWFESMKPLLPANVEYICRPVDDGSYAAAIRERDQQFDIVVIDGSDREGCARHAVNGLSPGGVVIWDNSDRTEYAGGIDSLTHRGFRRLDFHGQGPVNPKGWCTSILYRPENCLNV
jgi:predicted O-methyltransferase YrrM